MMLKKISKIYSRFRENRGKRFFFGGNFPFNGGKLSTRKIVSYMGARVLRARGSIMSKKCFPMCHFFVHF